MPEPSLSEFTNIRPRDTGKPATIIDSSQMVAQLNQSAQFKAQNDWRKYQQFLANFQDISKDAAAIAAMDVMPQDREYLDKQRAEVFSIIEKTPRALSGLGPEALKLKSTMSKYMSDATLSKQNYAFDWAHRKLMGENPEWATEDNRKIMDDFVKSPIGSRQQYSLQMPALVDMSKLLTGVFKDPTVTRTGYGWEKSPDGKFLQEMTTTTLDHDAFMNRWNTAMGYETGKYGTPIRGYAKQMFDQLPDREKKQWTKQDGTPDLDKFWDHVGETMFGSNKDIVKTEKGKLTPNRFEIDQAKFENDWAKMKAKFAHDFDLKRLGENLREDYRKFSQSHPLSNAANKNGAALNWQTVTYLQDALAHGEVVSGTDLTGLGVEKKVNWSPQIIQLFDKERKFGDKVLKISPTNITIDPDANLTVTYDDGTVEKATPNDFKGLIANKFKLTNAFESSGEELLGLFNSPSLDGNVNKYWDLITSGQYKAKQEDKKPADSGKAGEVGGDVDLSTLKDGTYKLTSGKHKGMTITIKGGELQ
jgi:hypothetical protein